MRTEDGARAWQVLSKRLLLPSLSVTKSSLLRQAVGGTAGDAVVSGVGGLAKYFPTMPVKVFLDRAVVPVRRRPERFPPEPCERVLPARSGRGICHEDAAIESHRERTAVEQSVVKGTECQRIWDQVRTVGGMPLYVGGIQGHRAVEQSNREPADGTTRIVSGEHRPGERAIANSPTEPGNLGFNAGGFEDRIVEAGREMLFDQRAGDVDGQLFVVPQGVENGGWESGTRIVPTQGCELGTTGGSGGDATGIRNIPQAVGLETPERIFRV